MPRGRPPKKPTNPIGEGVGVNIPPPGGPMVDILVEQIQKLTTAVQLLATAHPSTISGRIPQRNEAGTARNRPPPSETHSPHLENVHHRENDRFLDSSGSSWKGSSSAAPPKRQHDDNLKQKVEEMEAKLQKICVNDKKTYYSTTQSPFSQRIQDEIVPPRFKMPTLESYDGSTDPVDHLEGYRTLLRLQGASDALMCLAFPATLKKAARLWFSNLPPNSICSFQDLGDQLITHFKSHRPQPKSNDSLFAIKQDEGETLRSYVARFNTATLGISNFNESTAMSALKRGLRDGKLSFSLDKHFPNSYENCWIAH